MTDDLPISHPHLLDPWAMDPWQRFALEIDDPSPEGEKARKRLMNRVVTVPFQGER